MAKEKKNLGGVTPTKIYSKSADRTRVYPLAHAEKIVNSPIGDWEFVETPSNDTKSGTSQGASKEAEKSGDDSEGDKSSE